MTFYFYRSHVDADGQRVYKNAAGQEVLAGNGYYDPRDGSIHIDLNAGDEGSAMLSTIAHELAHFIQDWSPEKYRTFCRILMEGYSDRGQSVKELVLAKQAKYRQELGIELTYEQAYDEVIASSMESVLNDGNVMDLLDQLETADKSLWEKFCSFLEEIADLIHRTVQAFRNVHPESDEGRIVERMTEIHAQLQQAFAEGLHEGGENYRIGGKENTADNGGVKYAANYDYTKSFAEQLADFQNGTFPERDALMLGATPEVLRKIGLVALPMTINQQHVKDALYGTYKGTAQEKLDHTFTPQELATLPQKIADPVAIIHDKRTGKAYASESVIDVIVEMTAASGKQVLAAIQVGSNSTLDGNRVDANKVSTVHGNSDAIDRLVSAIQAEKSKEIAVFYIDKKRTTKALQRAGNPIPGQLSDLDGYIHSITEPGSPVKIRIATQTNTRQFKKWFKGSKVVNADGTPKIMYHGSPAQFTIFDKKKAKYSGQYGRGFYFTDSRSHAGTYGQQYSVYLNIRNPLQYGKGTVSREQVWTFLEAVAENEDYSIENYGTYDVDSILQTVMGEKQIVDAFQFIQDINVTAIGDMVEATELFNQVNGTKYDGIVAATETVAFYPEQIKSATDNICTFDGGNPDIRYSARYQQNASAAQLLREENAGMTEDVAGLNELLAVLRKQNGAKLRTASLAEAAVCLMKSSRNS